jgi:malonyl CoA-acyl carrier protein transacylase
VIVYARPIAVALGGSFCVSPGFDCVRVGILPNSSLVDIVFYRGLTMQHAVERDEQDRSDYAMCAVNSSRVGKTFNDAALCEIVVDTISNV